MADFPKADLDRMLTDARTTLESMRHGRQGISPNPHSAEVQPIEGVGAASDGRVKATAVFGGRLKNVELDPRMMRMASKGLSEQIILAVNAALDDLRAKAAEAAVGETVDTAALGRRLDELQAQGIQQMRLITQALSDTVSKIADNR